MTPKGDGKQNEETEKWHQKVMENKMKKCKNHILKWMDQDFNKIKTKGTQLHFKI